MRSIGLAGLASLALLAGFGAPAAAVDPLTVEDIVSQRRVRDPQLSPDGEWVVYVVSNPQPAGQQPDSNLFLVPVDGGLAHQLTHNPGQDDHPRIRPDGSGIAFLSRRPGPQAKVQIYLLPSGGGEARALTDEAQDVEELAWSPDGNSLAYSVRKGPDREPGERPEPARDHQDSDEVSQRLLKVHECERSVTTTVSPPDRSVFDFAWSPDGKRLAAFLADQPGPGEGFWNASLVLLDPQGAQSSILFSGAGSSKLAFSPDGERIACLSAPGESIAAATPVLVPTAGGQPIVLAPDHPGKVWDFAWTPDGRELILWGHEGVEGFLGSLDLAAGKVRVWYHLPLRAWGNPALSISADGRWLALLAEHPRHPPEVFLASRARRPLPPRRLTHTNPHLERRELGRVEAFRWEASDGLAIEGVLVHPAGRADFGKRPLVVMAHGGPQWQFWRGWLGNWHEPAQWLAAAGYRVLLPNPRGSTGRGARFARLARKDWGGADLADVLAGVDALVARGLADPERLAIVGWSYGGYLAAWAPTQTPRFRAAVAGAAVTDLLSMHGTSDIPRFLPDQFGLLPYQRPQPLLERSAVFYAHRSRTPTLIVHGAEDVRVPPGQARELYQALLDAGVRTRLLMFPREGHHFAETGHQRVYLEQMLAWLLAHVPPDRD